MADLIPILSTKYRIFLITQVSADKASDHLQAKTNLDQLVKQNAIRDHRVMFCTTQKGKEALIRQLNADLHIESDP